MLAWYPNAALVVPLVLPASAFGLRPVLNPAPSSVRASAPFIAMPS